MVEAIRGIKLYTTNTAVQTTLVFNNTQAAIVDDTNHKLTNISGPGFYTLAQSDPNFFSVANYQFYAFILNNKDPLSVYDGTSLYYQSIDLTAAPAAVQTLTTGLHVFLYKNRLVILRPTWSTDGVQPQQALFSALNNPFDFVTNVRGRGGFVNAPTGEWIQGAEFLRDELIVYFQESTWKLRYTAVDTAPYRWEKINDSRRADAPYATVGYQNFTTSIGSTGAIRCDGVNVERYDDKIIDFTQDDVDQTNIQLMNGLRYDLLNQQFLCYPSNNRVGEPTDFCDKWLVWNFLENSFSTYNIPATCFGFYVRATDLAWQDFTAANNLDLSWDDFQEQNWFSYFSNKNSKLGMFGNKDGYVYSLSPGYAFDDETRYGFTFTTKDFNPFVKDGKQARLGYLDFYFDNPDPGDEIDEDYELSIDLYTNENETPYRTIVLNPSADNWVKKRIHIGAIANFHRFRIYLSPDQIANSSVATRGFTLNGFILYMAPVGRIIS